MPGHPINTKSAYSVLCSSRFAAWTRAGFTGPKDRRGAAERLTALAGRPATYLGTFRPTALVRPAGRFSRSTRRAVCPSKRLKTRQRYPWRARASARLSARGLHRGNRAGRLGRQPRPSTWSRTTHRLRYSFSARPKYGTCKEESMKRTPRPHTSLKRLSELLSLALGAAVGAILANPMDTIHGWAELLDLLVFWR